MQGANRDMFSLPQTEDASIVIFPSVQTTDKRHTNKIPGKRGEGGAEDKRRAIQTAIQKTNASRVGS